MLTPFASTIILIAASILLLIVIPLLDGSRMFGRFISLRYTLVSLSLIMALGCILDFSHLSESSRNIVLMGGVILVGLFVVVRSLEKLKIGGKTISVSAQKGDAKITTTINGERSPLAKDKPNHDKQLVDDDTNCNEDSSEKFD